jgi:biopolymer transport protein ExbD
VRGRPIRLDGVSVTLAELTERLGAMMARRVADERVVFVRSDDGASYGQLAAVFDHIKEGGAETLAMLTDAPVAGE